MHKSRPVRLGGSASALQTLLPSIEAWEASHPGKRSVILMAGPTGSGKSTLAAKMKESGTILSLDRYFISPAITGDNRSIPHVLDTALIATDVAAMLMLPIGAEYEVPVYDFENSRRGGSEKLTIQRRLVIEGVYALRFFQNLDTPFKVYVTARLKLLRDRKVERDVRERGRSREEVIKRFKETVIPAVWDYVRLQKPLATYLVNTEKDTPALLEGLRKSAAPV